MHHLWLSHLHVFLFFPETQTHEAINEKSAIKSSDSDKEKTVDILENISEKTIEMKQEFFLAK